MATNATTWFYTEPEHNHYLIDERVNHTFWANRITALHLSCVRAEPPFRMTGEWRDIPIALEWVPNEYLVLSTPAEHNIDLLVIGVKEILGFLPTVSYVDSSSAMYAEWRVNDAEARFQVIQGDPNYRQIRQYEK